MDPAREADFGRRLSAVQQQAKNPADIKNPDRFKELVKNIFEIIDIYAKDHEGLEKYLLEMTTDLLRTAPSELSGISHEVQAQIQALKYHQQQIALELNGLAQEYFMHIRNPGGAAGPADHPELPPEVEGGAAFVDAAEPTTLVEKILRLCHTNGGFYTKEMHDAFYELNTTHGCFISGTLFNTEDGVLGYNEAAGTDIKPGDAHERDIPLDIELFTTHFYRALQSHNKIDLLLPVD